MFFLLERTNKILRELERQIVSNSQSITSFQMKEGNYASPTDADASPAPWKTYNEGDRWGGRDVHAWFRTTITIPDEMDGHPVVIKLRTGAVGWDATNPQLILYINGNLIQGIDVNHTEVLIERKAVKGTSYKVDLHAYSGMTENKSDLSLTFGVFHEQVKDLYFDLEVPLKIAELLHDDDKSKTDILNVLNHAVNLLDLRKPGSQAFHASVEAARKYMEDEFYNKLCGHEDVIASCVGHTHIDVAWLWTLAQTREKTARSFSTVLNLMDQYPEYIFMSSQPQLYKFLKEDHPDVYEKLKQRVKEGRWEAEGAMWVEADCNLTSGESLVRQVMFGTRFFEKEFGVKNEILWLPDVFGYSAALPQILKKSDIKYFMTTKISWNQFNKLPYDTFMWKGIDGTEILTHFITASDYQKQVKTHFTTYNGYLNPSQVKGAWQRYQQKNINNDVLISFGHGDGGGGPTLDMLENARRLAKGIPGCPRVKMTTSRDYFRKLEQTVGNSKYLPKWVGELYLEYHRGTYTSMAKNKRYNRKSELLYQDVEMLSSFSKLLGGQYPQDMINQGWETILLNQFHDIIPGSSIYEVYQDSHKQYEQILADGKNMLNQSLQSLVSNIKVEDRSLIVFNTLSFNRNDVVMINLPEDIKVPELVDENGRSIACQLVETDGGRKALAYVENIPAKGYKSYKIREAGKTNIQDNNIVVERNLMENRFFRVDLDEKGAIASLYDKVNQRQVLMANERGNRILAFEDRPMNWENWDIDIFYQEKMWEVDDVQSIEVVERGPVRGCLRITRKFLDSVIIQDMIIYSDIPRLDFSTQVDWKEDQILLKAAFPVDVHTDKATYEIQFGNVERPTHWNTSWDVARFEVCAQKWADLSEDGYGVSLLNDCKYGHDIRDGHMRLTLLKSGMEPNPKADRGHHEFTYSLYPHAGDWKQAKTVQMAYCVNVPLYAAVSARNSEGRLPEAVSMMQIDCDNVIIDTVKKAEDSDHIVVRMYEFCNRRTKAEFTFFRELESVTECNLMEKPLNDVPVQGNSFTFNIKPYEIKTFMLKVK
ncbi:MAG TPA: alpha-mannosidase [Clostridiales bacterium]|nr:alpha-mannosidase [Clostridiales bacterium]